MRPPVLQRAILGAEKLVDHYDYLLERPDVHRAPSLFSYTEIETVN